MGKRRQPKRAKVAPEDAQPGDIYEAEAPLPVEEQKKNINKRYDVRPIRPYPTESPALQLLVKMLINAAGSAAYRLYVWNRYAAM